MTASVNFSLAFTVNSALLRVSSLVMDISALIVHLTGWRVKRKRVVASAAPGIRDIRRRTMLPELPDAVKAGILAMIGIIGVTQKVTSNTKSRSHE